MSTVLRTLDLYKSYSLGKSEVPVLMNIQFKVEKGEYVAIMGQSGSGKSTLLNILGCLDTPSRGEYYFHEKPISSFGEAALAEIRNREIGFVFQNFNLLPRLTIEANVELPLIYAGFSKADRRRRVSEALERFGLTERRKHRPNEISGGQKQRVAIARALVKRPAVILADEPTGNLDSTTSEEIMRVFDELHREGNTLVVITHEDDVAARAQRILKLRDGQFVP